MKYEHTKRISELEAMGIFQITNRKISAARRALAKKRGIDPLFADQVKDVMTPEERCQYYIDKGYQRCAKDRTWAAERWLRLRKTLRVVPDEVRVAFNRKWNSENYYTPRRPEYGLDLLRALLLDYYGFESFVKVV